ncbi:MAG: hypothetical protein MK085_05750 [Phycisphaerales bacterium]|nr:hypothetical protein [Phycisphaerales bacterium]
MKVRRQVAAWEVAMSIRSLAVVLALLALSGAGGCAAQTATFPERDPARVWSAMVTAAEEPIYPDWRVIDNEVWTDRENGEIEILRILRRDSIEHGHDPRRESVIWKFRIRMIEVQPPTVQFSARQLVVPSHVWQQGQQFFDDVAALLGTTTVEEIEEVVEIDTPGVELTIEEEITIEETPPVGADLLEPSTDTSADDG